MVVAESTPGLYDDGYPRSSEADLDPGPNLSESLDNADRVAGNEHRLVREGQRPDRSPEDEGLEDADDAESRH